MVYAQALVSARPSRSPAVRLRSRGAWWRPAPPRWRTTISSSGLNGKAIFPPKEEFPAAGARLHPEECFVKDTAKSLMYAAISTAMTVGCGVLAYLYIPMQFAFWPVWLRTPP